MKHTNSVSDPNQNPNRRNRGNPFAPPAPGAERMALSRPPLHYPWIAHGRVRSLHQAPHPLHLSRKPKGS